jgi:CheY-like chemotaxis protein
MEVELVEQINVLLVDDDKGNTDFFRENLEIEFERFGVSAVITSIHSVSEALRTVKSAADNQESIDAVLVDLCLTSGSSDPNGLRVLRDIRDLHKGAYRLLYTGFHENNPGFARDYKDLADLTIVSLEINEGSSLSWRTIAGYIKSHLIDAGRLTAGPTAYDVEDVGIMSVLEEVGHDAPPSERADAGARILKLLALQCLEGRVAPESGLRIEFLAAGRSGANVCRLVFSSPSQSFVLKFGYDQGGLKRELEKNREAFDVLGQGPLMQVVGALASHRSGYHAIAANFASNSLGRVVTLRKWLGETATVDDAARIAEEVLTEMLVPLFNVDEVEEKKIDEWIGFRPGRQLRTLEAIKRYNGALGDARACNAASAKELVDRLTAFVRGDRDISGAPSEQATVKYVRSFGDLHSNNVLIQLGVNPRPFLIDASLFGKDHWSADHARLFADLLLRVRNCGIESMLWPAVTDADNEIVMLCERCQSPGSLGTPDGPTDAFIAHAVRQLDVSTHMAPLAIPSISWHWEWHVSLAREFLRQAAYEDLTPPRACMALLLADRHLEIAKGLSH